MALGQLIDTNLALDATLSGGNCLPALPLANLLLGQYLQRPARFADATSLAGTKFEVELAWPQQINLVGLVFHTFSRQARYRLTVAGADKNLAAPVYQTDWTPVIPRLWRSADLDWAAPNWWTGQPLSRDLALYPPNLWIPIPKTLCGRLRIEFDDRTNAAGWFDVGGLFVAKGWTPQINFERGRQLAITSRSLSEEAPSGRDFDETRRGRRTLTVTWAMLAKADAQRLFDAGARAGTTGVVVFLPDVDDPSSLLREAYPAKFTAPPAPTFGFEGLHTVSATFREIIA